MLIIVTVFAIGSEGSMNPSVAPAADAKFSHQALIEDTSGARCRRSDF
jgi:hypothetical protein